MEISLKDFKNVKPFNLIVRFQWNKCNPKENNNAEQKNTNQTTINFKNVKTLEVTSIGVL